MNGRRRLLQLAALSPVLWLGTAHAGTYLNRAAILVMAARRESDYLRSRVHDKELAQVLQVVAAARFDAASRMKVPKEVVQAHPHVLLTLENYERAAASAADGHVDRFHIYQQRAYHEDTVLRGVLKQLGWALPEVK